MLDEYAEVKIEAVTPGAKLEGVIHDQWVTIRSGRTRLELFDQDWHMSGVTGRDTPESQDRNVTHENRALSE